MGVNDEVYPVQGVKDKGSVESLWPGSMRLPCDSWLHYVC